MAPTPQSESGSTKCPACSGTGTVYEHHEPGMSEPLACDDCFGTGFLPHRFRNAEELGPCDLCGLTGDDDIHEPDALASRHARRTEEPKHQFEPCEHKPDICAYCNHHRSFDMHIGHARRTER